MLFRSADPARAAAGRTGAGPSPTCGAVAPGLGPKTASWVVRNHYGSDDVAVLDVHVIRAGVAAGVFDPAWTPGRHYRRMEQLFLAWADQDDVSAADLDAVIWAEQAAAARRRRTAR